MPFRSEAQRRYMYARHPEIAKRWTKKYGSKIQPKTKHDNNFYHNVKKQRLF